MKSQYNDGFKSVLNNKLWNEKRAFIGYGNPNARILIIGKECGISQSDAAYSNEYIKNFTLWKNRDESKSFDSVTRWVERDTCDWSIFDPIAPYKDQYFKYSWQKLSQNGKVEYDNFGTNRTWFNYQKLINYYRILGEGELKPNFLRVDFFRDCFITELSELCRPNNRHLDAEQRKAVELSIRNRFDMMHTTSSFWSQFSTVILACGPYSEALQNDRMLRKSIFGNANVVSDIWGKRIPQLSCGISNNLLMEIAEKIHDRGQ